MVYQTINAIVQQIQAELTAAEAHGMATGLLCVNEQAMSGYWLAELFEDGLPEGADDEQLLANLFEETQRLLSSDDFEFELLLPEDDDSQLGDQVAALKNWCHGFLLGVGSANLSSECSQEAREILKDITEFTRLDTEASGDEDESAFIEVSEYLRAAVILLKYEFFNTSAPTLH